MGGMNSFWNETHSGIMCRGPETCLRKGWISSDLISREKFSLLQLQFNNLSLSNKDANNILQAFRNSLNTLIYIQWQELEHGYSNNFTLFTSHTHNVRWLCFNRKRYRIRQVVQHKRKLNEFGILIGICIIIFFRVTQFAFFVAILPRNYMMFVYGGLH